LLLDLGGFWRLGLGRGRFAEKLGIERGEELIGGGLALALATPYHSAAAVIGDQRQVAVSFAPRDLVDRDRGQIAQLLAVAEVLADALDDPPDRLPVDPRQPARRRLVGLGRQPRDEVIEVAGEPRTVSRERDPLDVHAVLRAAHPP